jgi:hypothetical protein
MTTLQRVYATISIVAFSAALVGLIVELVRRWN